MSAGVGCYLNPLLLLHGGPVSLRNGVGPLWGFLLEQAASCEQLRVAAEYIL